MSTKKSRVVALPIEAGRIFSVDLGEGARVLRLLGHYGQQSVVLSGLSPFLFFLEMLVEEREESSGVLSEGINLPLLVPYDFVLVTLGESVPEDAEYLDSFFGPPIPPDGRQYNVLLYHVPGRHTLETKVASENGRRRELPSNG